MTDTYFSASSYDSLAGMLTTVAEGHIQIAYPNVLGPAKGCASNGGDPSTWYVAIRSNDAIVPPAGISLCDAEIGQAVLGIWAEQSR